MPIPVWAKGESPEPCPLYHSTVDWASRDFNIDISIT